MWASLIQQRPFKTPERKGPFSLPAEVLRAPESWGDVLQTDSPTAHRHTTDGVPLTRGHTLPVGSVAPIGSFKEVRPLSGRVQAASKNVGATLRTCHGGRPGTAARLYGSEPADAETMESCVGLPLCYQQPVFACALFPCGGLPLPQARAEGCVICAAKLSSTAHAVKIVISATSASILQDLHPSPSIGGARDGR